MDERERCVPFQLFLAKKAKEVVPATLETAIHVSQQRSARLPFARRLNASGRSRCAARRRAAVGPAARVGHAAPDLIARPEIGLIGNLPLLVDDAEHIQPLEQGAVIGEGQQRTYRGFAGR